MALRFKALVLRPLLASLALALIAAAPPPKTPPPPSTKSPAIPHSEMLSRSSEHLTRMREALREALIKLEEARNSKDVVKLNCVNEKLTQVKGLLRISEQADVALQESISKKEELSAEHEYTKVTIAAEKVSVLRGETEECIGQLAFRTDQNLNVEVEVPTNLPTTDPTVVLPTLPPPSRPPPASPTK